MHNMNGWDGSLHADGTKVTMGNLGRIGTY